MVSFIKSLFSNTEKTKKLIEQIHNNFYTEAERLLDDIAEDVDFEEKINALTSEKARLCKLGFTNTKKTQALENQLGELLLTRTEKILKSDVHMAINYFQQKYPNYKFITEESVKKLCKKYSLVYGSVKHYIGDVPDKNLKHIENFKIDDSDKCYLKEDNTYMRSIKSYVDFNKFNFTSYNILKKFFG